MFHLLSSKTFGFKETNIHKLCGSDATREKILEQWGNLIRESSTNDCVVIYYSGHGGMAELHADPEPDNADESDLGEMRRDSTKGWLEPRRIQFLVPTDFNSSSSKWTGILDSEISKLLMDTTAKTHNVTYILDCCHSSRLGRKLGDLVLTPKAKAFSYERLIPHVRRLKESGKLLLNPNWNNPYVARITAASETGVAYEAMRKDESMGMLTKWLVHMLQRETTHWSWRNIMVGVNTLYEKDFKHNEDRPVPQSAGIDGRTPFSLEVDSSDAIVADIKEHSVLIHGGRLRGVAEGDVFSLIPLMSESDPRVLPERSSGQDHMTTRVERVNALTSNGSDVSIKNHEIVLAHRMERQDPWQVLLPNGLDKRQLPRDFKKCERNKKHAVVEIRKGREGHQDTIALFAHCKTRIGSWMPDTPSNVKRILNTAGMYAQAQNILKFERGVNEEELTARIRIDIGVCRRRKEIRKYTCNRANKARQMAYEMGKRFQKLDFDVGDEYYINLRHSGSDPYFVFVFRVDAAGNTDFVSCANHMGIPLTASRRVFPVKLDRERCLGIPLDWPLPKNTTDKSVEETFVFIITNKEVSLGFLQTVTAQGHEANRHRAGKSFSSGHVPRTMGAYEPPAFDVIKIPYCLYASRDRKHGHHRHGDDNRNDDEKSKGRKHNGEVPVRKLPAPEQTEDGKKLDSRLRRHRVAASKGLTGAAIRTLKGIPPFVWVVNQHDVPITVVVSRFREHRFLMGVELNASGMGAGVNFETAMFKSPATTKTLAPMQKDPDGSIAMFPLWTRKDGYGVVSIFTGFDERRFIDNDMVPAGATAFFKGKANLEVVEHSGGGLIG
ncbi:caspase domain-containing protein [Apiospora arundinis]|uniref:Caspase domain-containing protein n=1 Tax=Apiospora arundinis TaxID=335852 RepID=A0ABR2IAG6_9PEZI